VNFLWAGVRQAWQLIASHDPYLFHTFWVTLKVATYPTLIALVIGLPIALLLGLGRFRGRGVLILLANAGLGLPPVVVGVVLSILMFPEAPLGRFQLYPSLRGVYVAQTVLALPVIIALSTAAISPLRGGVIAQARAFHAPWWRLGVLALREARVGIIAALIAAVGSGLSEVGAVVLVGGNIEWVDQTLASAALEQINAGHYSEGVAIGILLIGLIVIIAGVLTLVQYAGGQRHVRQQPS
jgi:tungstate transport system permease protein